MKERWTVPIFSAGPGNLKLKPLRLRDKPMLQRYLGARSHRLAVYAAANIYIWQGLFRIYWALIDGALCVFFRDAWGYFLYLPPLAAKPQPGAALKALAWMDRVNSNPTVSRIENIEETEVGLLRDHGLQCSLKSCDYLYLRSDMVNLAGDRFKSKRADCNYFSKHVSCSWRAYKRRDKAACAALYDTWAQERAAAHSDPLYRGMLKDSRNSFVRMLASLRDLHCQGRVLFQGSTLLACTFGCPVSQEMFCVVFEVCRPGVRGLSQYVFRRFCADLEGYALINAMDDSGLENLRRVKRSYRPCEEVNSYIARHAYVQHD